MENNFAFLNSSPLFSGITQEEIAEMRNLGFVRRKKFLKGERILRAGDKTEEPGVILSGGVNIENVDLWGNKSILNNLAAGQVFAETYAVCRESMMVDAVAAENCEVAFFNLNLLLNENNASAGWYIKLLNNSLRVFARKNLALSNRIFCTTPKSVRGRLLTYLSSLAVKNGKNSFFIPFNRQQLADYLNVERTALSKELGRMRDDNLIDFDKNFFKLKISVCE